MSYQTYTVADVKQKSSEELFDVISCFAGGGGSSTGYRLAGGKILLINEFVEEAIASYSENYPDTHQYSLMISKSILVKTFLIWRA